MRIFKLKYWWPWSVSWQIERDNESLRQELRETQERLNSVLSDQGPPFMSVARSMDPKIVNAIDDHAKEYIARNLETVLLPHVLRSLVDAWKSAPSSQSSDYAASAFMAMEDTYCARVRFTLPAVSTEIRLVLER